jgi:4'-phosphopantetheinyl transferase
MNTIDRIAKEKPKLSDQKVHVFLYQLSLFDSKELIYYLSEDEQIRADKLKIERKKEQFVITRSLLRKLLSSSLNKEPQDILFSYGQHGKPYIKAKVNNKSIEFNISHSGGYALIALTLENKLGIDIEEINPEIDYQSLSNRFFSDKEKNELLSLDREQQCDAFYHIWTRKESFIKATGKGIAFGLDRFSVSLDKNGDDGMEVITSEQLDNKYYCHDIIELEKYKAALTTCKKSNNIIISSL